ncbi:MAG TPA: hypothetical protein VFX21_08450 [Acidimicrobiia bacterium]|nr:hypothetical protein [Acidimicrobiia bacterium]
MTDASQLGKQATHADPAIGLAAAAALRKLADQLELAQVRRARELGWSWREIAHRLDLTKQAVHQRYAALVDPKAG